MHRYRNIRLIVFVLLLLAVNHAGLRAQLTFSSLHSNKSYHSSSWSYYTTSDGKASIDEMISKYNLNEFKPIRHTVVNAGIAKQYYWIHFEIANKENNACDLVININNSRLNELELFEKSNDSVRSLGKTGDFFQFSQRPVFHKNFVYEASFLPEQKKTYFLYINQIGHTLTLPVNIYTSKDFRSETVKDYLFSGLTYGILLFVAVLSVLFFLTTRHYLYLYYSLYVLTAIVWFLAYFGLGYQYLWGNYPYLQTAIAPLMACLNVALNIQICQMLLNISKNNRLLNNIAIATKILLITIAVFPLFVNLNSKGYAFNHTYLIILLSSVLLAMSIVSFAVIHYAWKGSIAARLYLLASLLKAGSIINLALLEPGITPAIYQMEKFLQVGIFVEIILLSYALATRYTHYKARTFVKIIEAHEKERSLISKEIHDGISNSLTGINYGIKNLTRDFDDLPAEKRIQLDNIFNELNKVQLDARNISHNTMPEYVRKSSIVEIVEKYVDDVQNKIIKNPDGTPSIQINFSTNKQLFNFSETVKLNLFRIFQEMLTNIQKHSRATVADFLFSYNKKELVIIAEDNGIGFSEADSEGGSGMGMKNIRSRVDLLDGIITVKSPAHKRSAEAGAAIELSNRKPEYGTMIKIRIPYKNTLFKNQPGYDY